MKSAPWLERGYAVHSHASNRAREEGDQALAAVGMLAE